MNTIQKIMNVLMNPNAELINIISIPCTLIEIIIYVNMCLVLLNIKTDRKHKYLCILTISIFSCINRFFITSPFNVILNILIIIFMYLIFFKVKVLEAAVGIGIPFILTALFEMISSQIYTLIFNKPYAEASSLPIYHLAFLAVVYTCLFIMLLFFKHFKVNISLFSNLNKRDYISTRNCNLRFYYRIFTIIYNCFL